MLSALVRRAIACLAVLAVTAAPAVARGGLIRDAALEHALSVLARPVLEAAGLPRSVDVLLIDDDRMNAFVANARTIFIHSGLLLRLDDAAELQAVLAHEAAHITGGHLTRRPAAARGAISAAKIGTLLSLAAAAAGGGRAGLGLALGTQSAAQRSLFAHTRAEESSADQASLRILAAAGVDPTAASRVLKRFEGQELLNVGRQDPYARTHPLTRDRLRAVAAGAAGLRVAQRDTRADAYWFSRAQAKLSGFTRAPSETLRRVRGDRSETAALARSIAYLRRGDAGRAVQSIDALIAARPGDAYYRELKGQILLESGQAAAAVAAYRQAVDLAPRVALIRAGLGRAQLAAGQDRAALETLSNARAREPFDPAMLRDLATAHARAGQPGLASVAVAERYAVLGRLDDARTQATRAAGLLPRGSAGWLRAQDILSSTGG